MSTENDQQARALLSQIAKGSESAFKQLYFLYEKNIFRYALSRLNDSFEAADVLSEVMMEVWKHAARFEGRSKVLTWILGIAFHKSYDRLRKRGKQTVNQDIDDFSEVLSDDSDIKMEDAIGAAQDAKSVHQCMQALSDQHRQVIELAFVEDMHYKDIAHVAKIPEGTVKTRVYHAKQALKHCLSKLSMGD